MLDQAGREQNYLAMTAHFKARMISMRNQSKMNSFRLTVVHYSLSMIERDYLNYDGPQVPKEQTTKKVIPNFELLDQAIKLDILVNAVIVFQVIKIIIYWKRLADLGMLQEGRCHCKLVKDIIDFKVSAEVRIEFNLDMQGLC